MKHLEKILETKPKYHELLGTKQALQILALFEKIESGKYNKEETHEIKMKGYLFPIYLRAIRADMQSFVNTFIDSYLDNKPYLTETKFVLDAGANIGYTAIQFEQWWPTSKIISIEPDSENYEFALKNTANYKNITLLKGALWNKAAYLNIEAGQEDGFVVREVSSVQKMKPENICTGVSVGQLMKEFNIPRIDFLKMNIEASEKEIFEENYKEWLPKTKALLIELHDGKNSGCSRSVFSAMNQFDFAVAETASYGILFTQESIYSSWYSKWYKEEIYIPKINKKRFPKFYLDK